MISRPTRLIAQGLTLTGLVAGTVAFASYDKSVDLVVDGKHRQVHAFGSSVADVLRSEGVQVGQHDLVSPAAGAPVRDGAQVVVRYGRQLAVTIDGHQRRYWTTALSVDEALSQVGLRSGEVRLSVSRSEPVGRQGLDLRLDTRKKVLLVVGGKQLRRTTYASTVGAVLAEAKVAPGQLDRLSAPLTRPLVDGAVIRLDRVTQQRVSTDRRVPFEVESTADDTLDKGTTKITTPGKSGTARTTYLDTFVNGARSSRVTVTSIVVTEPITQVQRVGTRAKTKPVPPAGTDGLNWAALAKCESGGNPRAVNPSGYYGLYQFSLSTWKRVGGTGNPIDASASEQTTRAKMLYARGGASQWSCGSHLSD